MGSVKCWRSVMRLTTRLSNSFSITRFLKTSLIKNKYCQTLRVRANLFPVHSRFLNNLRPVLIKKRILNLKKNWRRKGAKKCNIRSNLLSGWTNLRWKNLRKRFYKRFASWWLSHSFSGKISNQCLNFEYI